MYKPPSPLLMTVPISCLGRFRRQYMRIHQKDSSPITRGASPIHGLQLEHPIFHWSIYRMFVIPHFPRMNVVLYFVT